jgi:hypothetical protein
MQQIATISDDETLEYVHVGPLHGDLSRSRYDDDLKVIQSRNSSSTSSGSHVAAGLDFIEIFDRHALHNASWSFRNYDCLHHTLCDTLLNSAVDTVYVSPKTVAAAQGDLAKAAAKSKKKGQAVDVPVIPTNQLRFGGKRSFLVFKKPLCGGVVSTGSNQTIATSTTASGSCVSLVEDVRARGKKHWDVVGVVIDIGPPGDLFFSHSPGGNTEGNAAKVEIPIIVGGDRSTSLNVLLGLDLVFMRPKFIFVRLTANSVAELERDAKTATKFLTRNGFVAQQESEGYCHNRAKSGGLVHACIWGTRLNAFEIMKD